MRHDATCRKEADMTGLIAVGAYLVLLALIIIFNINSHRKD